MFNRIHTFNRIIAARFFSSIANMDEFNFSAHIFPWAFVHETFANGTFVRH
jgi:hypothetical protein